MGRLTPIGQEAHSLQDALDDVGDVNAIVAQYLADHDIGGSSFAHLMEDTDNSRLVADCTIVIGDYGGSYSDIRPNGHAEFYDDASGNEITIHAPTSEIRVASDAAGVSSFTPGRLHLSVAGGGFSQNIVVDEDGDLAIEGVGKIAVQP